METTRDRDLTGPSDLLVITPPFSPHDAGPPLGPAVLVAHARAAGLRAASVDLNIRYLRRFSGGSRDRLQVVGDHAKDRDRVERARRHFGASLELSPASPETVPSCADPVLSLPHGFDAIETAVEAMTAGAFWPAFLDEHLGARPAPAVLGLSIMGPAQVLPALAIARLAGLRWPSTTVVAGGSHVTLLANQIAQDARYAHHGLIDAFLPGHSEHVLVAFVRSVCLGTTRPRRGVLVAGKGWEPADDLPPDEWRTPEFERGELALYDRARLSLPLQTGRGCGYGRCAFCTYPAVEEFCAAWPGRVVDGVIDEALELGVAAVSVKDSLMTVPTMSRFGSAVHRRAPGLEWSATTKIAGSLDAGTLGRLRAAGCRTLEFGVETIHPRLQVTIAKVQELVLTERVIAACLEVGIAPVLNLLYGLPDERLDEAREQLAWWKSWQARGQGLVHGSHNLVEVNRRSPFATRPGRYGIELGAVGPWAFSYCWNAPAWRPAFAEELAAEQATELRLEAA
jgi:hypothetical protein